jgi:hypothetical protein
MCYKKNRLWEQLLNDKERTFSIKYVEKKKLEDKLINNNGTKNVD